MIVLEEIGNVVKGVIGNVFLWPLFISIIILIFEIIHYKSKKGGSNR